MTALRQGPEAVAQAISATLQAHLNGDIDTQWTAWSAGDPSGEVTPPKLYPAKYYVFRRDLIGSADYPVVLISPGPGSQLLLNHATTPNVVGAAWTLERHHLFVEVGMLGSDEYQLQASVTRLVYALRTCLLKHMELDGDPATLLSGYGGGLTIGQFGVGHAIDEGSALGKMLQVWGGVEVFVEVMEAVQ